ncbi:MAG: cytochrome ubiquinol oxidase subunit I [Ignavibacteriales bacterium]|nr:MAG: cytochrome ubiquinol oxidase subunit I [Ignavibacteriales bacterium]
MDAVLLARFQFAMTIGFHFLFPPLSIGLAWILVIVEALGWKKKNEFYVSIGKFFGKILALIFAVGVATGIVMEFQFGTNWAEYSKFVGDIFGAPLAAEGVFAFFLESTFLGLYIFGRERVSKGVHFFSILMVAVGATISAFWILVANSWQQTPAGFVIRNGRAELTNFWEAVFNPSTLVRFFHTFNAALISGAFLMAGVSALLILKNKEVETAKKSMKVAVIFGLIVSLLEVFPFGHEHGRQVAQTQPEKFAALQGLYTTQTGAPIALFAFPTNHPPDLKAKIEIPGVLSWLAFGDFNAKVKGINEFPKDEIPPLFLTFVSYHNMVILGMYFIFIMALTLFLIRKDKLWEKKKVLKLLAWSIPLPLIACQLGWIAAEVGRQPWIVYKLMKTRDAVSVTVGTGELLFSIILFGLIYILLLSVFLFLLKRKINHGPDPIKGKEVLA